MEKILRITGYQVENLTDLKEVAPAAFSGEHNRTKVYSFLSTTEILEKLALLGWNITYAKQQGSSQYSRHIIRLTNPDLGYMPLKNDRVRPQLILDNSHNGGSSAQLHMGLFRMVCESELVICLPNLFSNIKFRHMGLDFEELKGIMTKMAEQYQEVGNHIAEMQEIILTKEQQIDFAYKGVAYKDPRFIKDDGTIDFDLLKKRVNPEVLLEPMRGGDAPKTLWETFQTVREWLIKGGFAQTSETGRISRSKTVNNAVRQIALNKTLWLMAEDFLGETKEQSTFEKLIAASTTTTGLEESMIDNGVRTYTTSKGDTKEVMVISDLGDGRMQVKDVNSKLIFADLLQNFHKNIG